MPMLTYAKVRCACQTPLPCLTRYFSPPVGPGMIFAGERKQGGGTELEQPADRRIFVEEVMRDESGGKRRLVSRLFGGINMKWLTVILFAVGAAVVTAVFLVAPVFEDTSFERMGVYLEAWIFFAVIIMTNCKRPLEAAVKTFAFFLISQPLIYLFQVPFSWQGWHIFAYYKTWFIWTLFTFPLAYAGWYVTKRNWLGLLILAPVLVFLGYTCWQCAAECVGRFPHLLIAALFCLLQIVLYVWAFFPASGRTRR